MGRSDDDRAALRALPPGAWDGYLAERSRLPGPRANLELAQVVAEEAPATLVRRYAAAADEYLALCGAIGLGRLLADGDAGAAEELRRLAGDGRWRVREGVALGLQRLGDTDLRRWAASDDRDVRWVVRENLKKARLLKADPARCAELRALAG